MVDVRKPNRLTGWVVGVVQSLVMVGVVVALVMAGVLLFRRTFLERYLEKATGYPWQVESFDLDPRCSMIELHGVTVGNIAPYPQMPLAKVRRIRLEWDPSASQQFPRRLRLLEIEVDQLTLIRLDGNRFNVLSFVEALVRAWGSEPTPTRSASAEVAEGGAKPQPGARVRDSLLIDECWLIWDTLIALDEEAKGEKRKEVLIHYEGYQKNVSRIREITDPAIKVAKEEVDTFYFFNYLGDSIRGLLD